MVRVHERVGRRQLQAKGYSFVIPADDALRT